MLNSSLVWLFWAEGYFQKDLILAATSWYFFFYFFNTTSFSISTYGNLSIHLTIGLGWSFLYFETSQGLKSGIELVIAFCLFSLTL